MSNHALIQPGGFTPTTEIMHAQVSLVGNFMLHLIVLLNFMYSVNATDLQCDPDASLCPDSTLLCTCSGTGTVVRWTTNKAGAFDSPDGATFISGLDVVNSTRSANGFLLTFLNNSVDNLTTILQVSATEVAGVQVSCLIGGVTYSTTPDLAGEFKSQSSYYVQLKCNHGTCTCI